MVTAGVTGWALAERVLPTGAVCPNYDYAVVQRNYAINPTAPTDLQVVASVARVKSPGRSHALSELLADPKVIVDALHADIRSFTLTASQSAGTKRGQGKGSFVSSVTSLVDNFYAGVVQPLKPWTPPAPKPKAAPTADGGSPSSVLSTTADASQVVEGAPAPAVTNRPELAAPAAWPAASTT